MKISFLAVISAALTLTGCATFPTPESLVSERPASLQDIIDQVQCEISAAYSSNEVVMRKSLQGFVAEGQLIIKGGVTVASNPSITLAPMGLPVGTQIPLGTGLSSGVNTEREFDFTVFVDSVDPATATGQKLAQFCAIRAEQPLGSGLQVDSYLEAFAAAVNREGSVVTLSGLIYGVTFDASVGSNGGLKFNTGVVSVDLGKPGPTSKHSNELRITMAKPGTSGGSDRGGGGTPTQPKIDFEMFRLNQTPYERSTE